MTLEEEVNNASYNPIQEQLLHIIEKKTSNESDNYFRIVISFYLTQIASSMRAYINGKVFKNIKMYDETKSSLKTWISRIAYNESISFLRHKSLPVIYYEDREGEVDKLSDTEVEETFGHPNPETVQLIRAALRHLPPDERAIITMFYYEEMSLKDIAYVTESIPTTVASKLSRTRKKLYKIIKMLQS